MDGILTFILGITIFGIVLFLISGLAAKVSGKSVGYRGGITYSGGTLADPDTLDNIANDVRKLVDKKFRNRKEIETECNRELQEALFPIERTLSTISSMRTNNISYDYFNHRPFGNELLTYLGKNMSYISSSQRLSSDDKEKLKELAIDLYKKKKKLPSR